MAERTQPHHIPVDDLSAYADREIHEPAERDRIEAHLAECPECRDELQQLQAISSLLSSLPEPEVPRSFRLSQDDLPGSSPAPPVEIAPWFIRYQSTFQAASIAAVVALVLLVTVQVLPLAGDDSADDVDIATDAPSELAQPDAEGLDEDNDLEIAQDEAVEDAAESAPTDDRDAGDAGIAGVEDEEAVEEADEDRAAMPEADADADAPADTEATDDARSTHALTAAEDDDGISPLQIALIGTALVAVILLGIGFILPRWWTSSARRS